MVNVCPQCATENSLTAKFCKKCGGRLTGAAAVPPASIQPPAAPVAPPAPVSPRPGAPSIGGIQAAMEKFSCQACGQANDPGAKFCKKCGTMLARPKASAPPAAAPSAFTPAPVAAAPVQAPVQPPVVASTPTPTPTPTPIPAPRPAPRPATAFPTNLPPAFPADPAAVQGGSKGVLIGIA